MVGDELGQANLEKILSSLSGVLPKEKRDGKFKFGISVYGDLKLNEKKMGMEIKRILKENGISSRWVISKEKQLSSVVVDTNKLVTEKGMEVVIMRMGEKIFIGKTLAVQPFRELSFRDYGRPSRDDLSGMLPPKLAQIMINLAGVNKFARATRDGKDGMREDSEMASGHEKEIKILDPFCGSGTILTEAMLMGFRNLVGVDIAEKAVEEKKKNVGRLKDKFDLRDVTPEIIKGSAADLSELIGAESVDAIITEPFLGPQRGHVDLRKIKKELEDLYSQALGEFKKVLKKDGKIVMIWPVFHRGEEWVQLSPEIDGFKIVNPLKDAGGFINISKGLTNRGTLIYGREGQKVWREIVVLEK